MTAGTRGRGDDAGETASGSVRSRDGTVIAYERHGDGPPIVCVGGALQHRAIDAGSARLARLLAPQFAVWLYDRRGRGESGDRSPCAVGGSGGSGVSQASRPAGGDDGASAADAADAADAAGALARELDDLAALISEAGGVVCLYGSSSGAALALEAAAAGLPIERLALYEPPYVADGGPPRASADRFGRFVELAGSGRRGHAIEQFVQDAGIPAKLTARLHEAPIWPALERVAHTLPYDMAVMRDGAVPLRRAAGVATPSLVMHGGDGCARMRDASRALAEAMPAARHRTLPGQTHDVAPAAVAPELAGFFAPRR